MGRILRWGLVQLCQSLVNGFYLSCYCGLCLQVQQIYIQATGPSLSFKHPTWQSLAMYTGRRSSQPRARSSLLSQKDYEVEPNVISIHLSGNGEVHPQVKEII